MGRWFSLGGGARWACRMAVLAACLGPSVARAQPVPRDPVTAEALFVEGKRLLQAKDYAGACPKLAESQRLDPSGGTIFALALCYEGAGKTATAWATFNEALAEARRDQRPDREAGALEHVHGLEHLLTRVRVDVPHPVPGLEVFRDGAPVGSVLWGTAIPVDPGRYTFEARAPGKVPWKWTTVIDRPGDVVAFPVPELANVPKVALETTAQTSAPAAKRSYVLPLVGLGVGVVTAAVGTGLAVKAASDWSAAQKNTTSARVNQASSAGTEADVATGFFVATGVVLAASGVLMALVLTSPDSHATARPATALRLAPLVGSDGTFGLALGGSLW